jgi:TRAP-type mannitol/chloroaromatic compound transport system substrate-binding protein
MVELQKAGVKIHTTPKSVLDAQLKAWDGVLAEQTKDAFFKKVVDSQKEWAKRVGAYWAANNVDPNPAYKHFFG